MTTAQRTELERAIEIAREKGHKVFTAKCNATGETVYTVRSHSDVTHYYILYIRDGRIHCQCQAHKQGHICSHAAAVRLFLIEQRDALASVKAQDRKDAQEAVLAETAATVSHTTSTAVGNMYEASFACKRDTALLVDHTPATFSMFRCPEVR